MAVPTGFEPALSSLTGTYARPLHHGTKRRSCCARRQCSHARNGPSIRSQLSARSTALCNNAPMWIVLQDRFRRPFHVNDDTIEWIEALADTRLHMTSGETKITCMSATEVLATMVAARRINVHNPPQVRPHREDVEAWDSDRRQ